MTFSMLHVLHVLYLCYQNTIKIRAVFVIQGEHFMILPIPYYSNR